MLILGALGLGALFGGAALVISPSGKLLGMPVSLLDNSPFNDFLIPGVILFVILGLIPIALGVGLVRQNDSKTMESLNLYPDMFWAWTGSIYVAFALILWIQIEMSYLQSVHWVHTLYMCWAIAIIGVALMPSVRKFYTKTA